MQASLFLSKSKAAARPLISASCAQFSAAASSSDKAQLFDELIATASQISDYNYKTYFVRRATEDKADMDSISESDLQERLAQMKRIKAVQNLYSHEVSVVDARKSQ